MINTFELSASMNEWMNKVFIEYLMEYIKFYPASPDHGVQEVQPTKLTNVPWS